MFKVTPLPIGKEVENLYPFQTTRKIEGNCLNCTKPVLD